MGVTLPNLSSLIFQKVHDLLFYYQSTLYENTEFWSHFYIKIKNQTHTAPTIPTSDLKKLEEITVTDFDRHDGVMLLAFNPVINQMIFENK